MSTAGSFNQQTLFECLICPGTRTQRWTDMMSALKGHRLTHSHPRQRSQRLEHVDVPKDVPGCDRSPEEGSLNQTGLCMSSQIIAAWAEKYNRWKVLNEIAKGEVGVGQGKRLRNKKKQCGQGTTPMAIGCFFKASGEFSQMPCLHMGYFMSSS